jgi:hypothetical protein
VLPKQADAAAVSLCTACVQLVQYMMRHKRRLAAVLGSPCIICINICCHSSYCTLLFPLVLQPPPAGCGPAGDPCQALAMAQCQRSMLHHPPLTSPSKTYACHDSADLNNVRCTNLD